MKNRLFQINENGKTVFMCIEAKDAASALRKAIKNNQNKSTEYIQNGMTTDDSDVVWWAHEIDPTTGAAPLGDRVDSAFGLVYVNTRGNLKIGAIYRGNGNSW